MIKYIGVYNFDAYLGYLKLQRSGRVSFYPAYYDLGSKVRHNVMSMYSWRICRKTRGDYKEYLKRHGLNPDKDYTEFELLGLTGGKVLGDGYIFKILHNKAKQ